MQNRPQDNRPVTFVPPNRQRNDYGKARKGTPCHVSVYDAIYGVSTSASSLRRAAPDGLFCTGNIALVAQILLDLTEALEALGSAERDEVDAIFDRSVGKLIQAITPFLAETEAIVPVQRALLSIPGRRHTGIGLEKLSEALEAVDARLGPQMGGFSRLLENAIHAGDLEEVVRLQPDWVNEPQRALAHRLAATARALDALDDFSHALSVRSEWPAGAMVLLCLASLLPPALRETMEKNWLPARGYSAPLLALLRYRSALSDLTPEDVAQADAQGLSQALALWILAARVAEGTHIEHARDRACLDVLLEKAELVPLEVFDVAGLWPELMDESSQ